MLKEREDDLKEVTIQSEKILEKLREANKEVEYENDPKLEVVALMNGNLDIWEYEVQ